MNILGIETSCDETAAAVVQNGEKILSNIVASQIDIHAKFGGVVPEVAARSHIEHILPVVQSALDDAETGWDSIDAIAVTAGPGLLGSLLIGTLTARTLAVIYDKPLYGLNHVEAHVYANFLQPLLAKRPSPDTKPAQTLDDKRLTISEFVPPQFPLLALIVSGGHTQLVLFRDHLEYEVLGITRDDAAGEAFDKVSKLLGLGYPGGPAIAKAASNGKADAYAFTKPRLDNPQDFSFSGLKTAVLRLVQDLAGKDFTAHSVGLSELLSEQQINDVAASFQKTVVDILVGHTVKAFEAFNPKSVVIAGGVAANQALREELASQLPIEIRYAPMNLCTDNAAMIAALGYHVAKAKRLSDPFTLEADSALFM